MAKNFILCFEAKTKPFPCGFLMWYKFLSLNGKIFFIDDVLTISISDIDPILLTIKSISMTAGEKPKSGLRLLS